MATLTRLFRRKRPGNDGAPERPDALLASASLRDKKQVRAALTAKVDWQAEAWHDYRDIPEIQYGINWRANACSRARLYVGKIDPDGSSKPVPVTDDDPNAAALLAPLKELAGGQLGQSEMLRRLTILFDVPGEAWLVGFDDTEQDGRRRWIIASRTELKSDGSGGLKLKDPEDPNRILSFDVETDEVSVSHLWRADPEDTARPHSPMVSLRAVAKEIRDLAAHTQASAESRLAGAGVWFVPDGITFPAPEQSEGTVNPTGAGQFIPTLIQAMGAPLRNRDDASSIVPIVATGNAEAIKESKHFTFSTPLDKAAKDLLEGAIRRAATGLDIPPEVLLGTADINHWGAWQMAEDAIRLHIEPTLGLECDAFTTWFYRPAIEAFGIPDADQYVIWYDTSDLKQRPNRAPEAAEAHGKGLLSNAAYLRELGFSEEDMPDEEEQRVALLRQIALTQPQLAASALAALGINLPTVAMPQESVESVEVERLPAGTPPELPRNSPPELPAAPGPALTASAHAWRTACLDLAVTRALERAGRWISRATPRSQRAGLANIPPAEVYLKTVVEPDDLDTMLDGAYREFHQVTPGETCLHAAVDDYVRALLVAREPHHHHYLDKAITRYRCDDQAAA